MMPQGMRCKLHVGISAFITITKIMHWLYNLVLIEIFKKKNSLRNICTFLCYFPWILRSTTDSPGTGKTFWKSEPVVSFFLHEFPDFQMAAQWHPFISFPILLTYCVLRLQNLLMNTKLICDRIIYFPNWHKIETKQTFENSLCSEKNLKQNMKIFYITFA